MNLTRKDALTVAWLAGFGASAPGIALAMGSSTVGMGGTSTNQPVTDADMPRIETLRENDDYSVFMNPGVSESLRLQALRKLFRSAKFNQGDGLANYAGDYTSFASDHTRLTGLGEAITASTMQ